jgi:hypothetical protein
MAKFSSQNRQYCTYLVTLIGIALRHVEFEFGCEVNI